MAVKNIRKAQVATRIREAGERAKAEAEARGLTQANSNGVSEVNGPTGPEPTRYGDWERKGIASDF